jgi:hypothetical protein
MTAVVFGHHPGHVFETDQATGNRASPTLPVFPSQSKQGFDVSGARRAKPLERFFESPFAFPSERRLGQVRQRPPVPVPQLGDPNAEEIPLGFRQVRNVFRETSACPLRRPTELFAAQTTPGLRQQRRGRFERQQMGFQFTSFHWDSLRLLYGPPPFPVYAKDGRKFFSVDVARRAGIALPTGTQSR